ncbi:MAG: hypothetical protein KTM48_03545 [Wolbachia endosymbiont of Pissodes strobi]|nr:hypothetical protein [Wolbachia endosymbiont of Pissodes strobi]
MPLLLCQLANKSLSLSLSLSLSVIATFIFLSTFRAIYRLPILLCSTSVPLLPLAQWANTNLKNRIITLFFINNWGDNIDSNYCDHAWRSVIALTMCNPYG